MMWKKEKQGREDEEARVRKKGKEVREAVLYWNVYER